MSRTKPRLGGIAIAAGILLLLYVTSFLFAPLMAGVAPDFVTVLRSLIYTGIAVLLLIRRRNVVFGIAFFVLATFAGFSAVTLFINLPDEPYFAQQGATALMFIGMGIITLRRLNGPRRGPWILAFVPFAIFLLLVTGFGLSGNAAYGADYLIGLFLLCVSMLLAAIAFQSAPKGRAAMEAQPSAPAPKPEPKQQPQPAPEPKPEPKPAAVTYEEADVEILDDDPA